MPKTFATPTALTWRARTARGAWSGASSQELSTPWGSWPTAAPGTGRKVLHYSLHWVRAGEATEGVGGSLEGLITPFLVLVTKIKLLKKGQFSTLKRALFNLENRELFSGKREFFNFKKGTFQKKKSQFVFIPVIGLFSLKQKGTFLRKRAFSAKKANYFFS